MDSQCLKDSLSEALLLGCLMGVWRTLPIITRHMWVKWTLFLRTPVYQIWYVCLKRYIRHAFVLSPVQEYASLQVSEPQIREGMERVQPQTEDDLFPCACHRKKVTRTGPLAMLASELRATQVLLHSFPATWFPPGASRQLILAEADIAGTDKAKDRR